MKQQSRTLPKQSISFNKTPTTHTQQIAILQERGMVVNDPKEAEFYLQHINYYRLSAYWRFYEKDQQNHIFKSGVCFVDILNIYIFDRELRLLILDAIERIEVSIRSQWAYHLAHKTGAYAYLEDQLVSNKQRGKENTEKLKVQIEHSSEKLIKYFKNSNQEPPVWVVCELMSLGLLSRFYSNLKPISTANAIAVIYGLHANILKSWLHHLSEIRNICAHHGRLWDKRFTFRPKLPNHQPTELITQCQIGSSKLYNTLIILLYLMDIIAPQHHWQKN